MLTAAHLRFHLGRLLDELAPRRRELRRLRAKWGQPGAKEGVAIRRYFDLARDPAARTVDEKTWTDLELPKVFSVLDSTESPLGSQYLYRRLRTYVDSPVELAQCHAICEALCTDAAMREEIQLRLSGLHDEANSQLADAIFGPAPARTPAMGLLPWWSFACLTALAVVVAMKVSIWIWLATLGVNLLLIFRFTLPLHRELDVLRGCYRMLCVADALAALPAGANAPPQLSKPFARRRRRGLGRARRWAGCRCCTGR